MCLLLQNFLHVNSLKSRQLTICFSESGPWLGNLIVLTVRVNDFLNWRCIDNVELMGVHVYEAESQRLAPMTHLHTCFLPE